MRKAQPMSNKNNSESVTSLEPSDEIQHTPYSPPESCQYCKPAGSFTFKGSEYPAYIVLCERCSQLADAYTRGRRYEYDIVHGAGAFDIEQQKGDAYT